MTILNLPILEPWERSIYIPLFNCFLPEINFLYYFTIQWFLVLRHKITSVNEVGVTLENLLHTAKTKRKQEAEIKELKAPGLKGNSHVGYVFETACIRLQRRKEKL